MTFEYYYRAALERGLPDTEENRNLCKTTWDAAITAAVAACYKSANLIPIDEARPAISQLHTWWADEAPTLTP
jgi:hypothetical protein